MTSTPHVSRRTLLRGTLGLAMVGTVSACAPSGGSSSSGGSGGGDAKSWPTKSVTFLVPAKPGGGWDTTARGFADVVTKAKLTDQKFDVVNREGGGGATGLAQLTGQYKGNPDVLMIGGLVMIGALTQANSPLKVTDATAIATLTSETEAIVVRKASKFTDFKQVVEAYKKDPTSVTFGGGSAGGSDHIALGLALKAAGADPSKIKYIGYSGGGEATAGILAGDVEVGVSGLSEFTGQLEDGAMRLLAVTSSNAPEVGGKKAPTLKDAGIDVDFVNWRALFAAPGISDADKTAITSFVTKVHDSQEWKDLLVKNGWGDDFRTGTEASDFVSKQQDAIHQTMKDLGL